MKSTCYWLSMKTVCFEHEFYVKKLQLSLARALWQKVVFPPKARLSLESQSFETTFADYSSCEAYEQEPEYSPELYEATLSRDCRENDAQQEDFSNQLEKGDPGITSSDLCTRSPANCEEPTAGNTVCLKERSISERSWRRLGQPTESDAWPGKLRAQSRRHTVVLWLLKRIRYRIRSLSVHFHGWQPTPVILWQSKSGAQERIFPKKKGLPIEALTKRNQA